ncbi:hypothetical protein ACH5RR_024842 [Cinchona calisaya]|uniref:Uncharacterized protein n=1 Tax=Cinchona calisaya TaxID=153742 RepID=A0ABD2Z1E7_9GENT
MRCLRLQLLVQVSGSILGIDYDMEDEDGGEARKKKEVGSDVEFREIDACGFGVLLFLTCIYFFWKFKLSNGIFLVPFVVLECRFAACFFFHHFA